MLTELVTYLRKITTSTKNSHAHKQKTECFSCFLPVSLFLRSVARAGRLTSGGSFFNSRTPHFHFQWTRRYDRQTQYRKFSTSLASTRHAPPPTKALTAFHLRMSSRRFSGAARAKKANTWRVGNRAMNISSRPLGVVPGLTFASRLVEKRPFFEGGPDRRSFGSARARGRIENSDRETARRSPRRPRKSGVPGVPLGERAWLCRRCELLPRRRGPSRSQPLPAPSGCWDWNPRDKSTKRGWPDEGRAVVAWSTRPTLVTISSERGDARLPSAGARYPAVGSG